MTTKNQRGNIETAGSSITLQKGGSAEILIQAGANVSNITITLPASTATLIDTTSTQTLSNKTLDNTTTYAAKDTLFILQDDGDSTKKAKFELSNITTATTRTLTLPNATTTLAGYSDKLSVFAATTSAELASVISDETGSGALVFASSPTLTTPVLGAATATTINKVTITAPATSSTLTIADGKTLTLSNTLTFTGTDGSSVAFGTGGTAAFTSNKLSAFAATTSAELAGVISDETGSGSLVFATSPTFVTPVLGTPSSGNAANLTGIPLGTDASLTGTLSIAKGGTGQTSANNALNALLPSQGSNSGKALLTDGSNTSWTTIPANGSTFLAADGSVSAPGFAFNSDTNTGLYRIGADNIGFATAGAQAGNISSTGAWTLGLSSGGGVPLTVRGYNNIAGTPVTTNSANGLIKIGDNAAYGGVIQFSDTSSTTLYIDNLYNSDSSSTQFRTKTAATAVVAGFYTGAGAWTLGGTGVAHNHIINGNTITFTPGTGSTVSFAAGGASSTNLQLNAKGASGGIQFYCNSGEKGSVDPNGAWVFGASGATPTHRLNTANASTVGAAGGASALPATPTGYITININGTDRKIPYYAT